jgi:hypothetical protein
VPVRRELTLRLANSPGALADVCALLSAERVSITAMSLERSGQLRVVVDNHVRAVGVLSSQHYQIMERDVVAVTVPHDAGGLTAAVRLLADAGVNVEYAYGGAADGMDRAVVVIGVEDAARAAAAAGL